MTNHDDELRRMLAQADPAAELQAPGGLLDRVLDDIRPTGTARHRTWLERHWQGSLIAAAAVASLALAVPVLAPGLPGQDRSAPAVSQPEAAVKSSDEGMAAPVQSLARPAPAPDSPAADSPAAEPALVRSASLTVGTEDADGQAAAFVATVDGLGGRVVSQTVVTRGSASPPVAVEPAMGGMPYPMYPTGPGVYLTVQVPEDRFGEALQAARATGDVVQLQQSSYDVGAQVSDVAARIEALKTSLATLNGLLGRATSVSDVVALEAAISQRQAELDGLLAQQRQLAEQTRMSSIALALMTPRDAENSIDPQAPQSWWASFLDGLGDLWTWLGRALLICSPLLLAGAVIWWVRRRRRAAGGASA